jgi:two-component sensor histidine kinase
MTGDHATDEADADRVVTNTQKATRIGLIVNESVTKAFEACVSGRRCWDHWVKLRRTSTELTLVVEDDGVGCPEEAKNGLGSRLTPLLVQQLGGTMTRESATPGCRIMITIPSAVA